MSDRGDICAQTLAQTKKKVEFNKCSSMIAVLNGHMLDRLKYFMHCRWYNEQNDVRDTLTPA